MAGIALANSERACSFCSADRQVLAGGGSIGNWN